MCVFTNSRIISKISHIIFEFKNAFKRRQKINPYKIEFYRHYKAFKHHKKGNILLFYALSLLPLIGFMGISSDYAKFITAEQKLQTVADNVSLYMASYVVKNGDTNLKTVATNYLQIIENWDENLNTTKIITPYIDDIQYVDAEKAVLKTSVATDVETFFWNFFNNGEKNITVVASAKSVMPKYRYLDIALVLDFSTSMEEDASNGKTRLENLKEAVNAFLDDMQLKKNATGDNIRIGISPIHSLVSIKTTVPDFKGNQLNFSKADMSGTINALSAIMPKPTESDAAKWKAVKDLWENYYNGTDWKYIDVRGDAEYANRWIDAALYHGPLATDSDDGIGTLFDSSETMTAGYSNNSHVNYVVNDNGSYRLLNTPNFPAPTSTAPTSYVYKSSGSINVPTTFRPLSCNAGNTGANWFGNHINFAKGGTNDNDTSNNCKSLPVWNNALWLWYLIGEEWNGCVESRPYNKNLDISLEMNLSNPDHKFVPMAPALRSHKNDSTNYAYNEYGAIGSTTAITHYVADLYNNQDLFHRNLGTYYFYHAISKTNATRSIFCQPLLPLQTNFDVIKNYMNNVQLSITTNSPEGLYWGWHLVSPNKPFDAAGPYNDSYKKIIIVITDGLPNLIKNSYGSSFENQFDPIDDDPATTSNKTQNIIDRYKALCTNIKNYEVTNGGVEIYAIGVGEENDLEKECVTDVDHYSSIDVTQLTQKLKNIAKQIGKVSIVE